MRISILVPIYNVESYIERCARSLFEQTYPDIEYIFVDDCSPDHSIDTLLRVLENYPSRRNQVRIIKHDKNRGLAAARNTAVDNCKSEFLIHVDSDDYLELDAIELLVNKQIETGADIISGQALLHNESSVCLMERPQFVDKKDFVADMIKPSMHHTIWGRLIRTALYKDHQIQAVEGVNIGEDLQVMSQLFYFAKKIESVWNVIYHYENSNPNSYMNINSQKKLERSLQDTQSMEIVRDFFKNIKEVEYFDLTEKYLCHYYINLLHFYAEQNDKENFEKNKRKFMHLKESNRTIRKIVQRFVTNFTAHKYWVRFHS